MDYLNFDPVVGIVSGTSLDGQYAGRNPTVAAPCVARKLSGWSEWFANHDLRIDMSLVERLRKEMNLSYFEVEELAKKSHQEPFGREDSDEARQLELYYKLRELTALVFHQNSTPLKPIVLHSGAPTTGVI
jgi:hypothetical protein